MAVIAGSGSEIAGLTCLPNELEQRVEQLYNCATAQLYDHTIVRLYILAVVSTR
jgi:hypothetical protein